MRGEQKAIKVLHLDGEPDFLAVTKAFLERDAFSVDTATSAEEGIELLKGGKYDVVVSDYKMPVIDGLAFLKTLRASGNTIPFIMFTGKGREEVAMEALNRGANGYLQKGVDVESMYGTLMHAIKQEVETKRAEDELVEIKKEQQIVLDSVPAMIFHMDSDSNYIYANRCFADTFGLKPEDFRDKSIKAIFPEEAETYIKSDKEVVKSGIPKIRIIDEIITPKGKRWLRTDKVPVKDADGNVTGIIGFGLDITARKKAEEELRNANKQLQDIIEFLPDATLVIDQDKKVIAWNRAIEEMTGVRKEDIIGKGDYAYAVAFYGVRRPILIDLIFLSDKEIETRYDYVKREGNTLFAEVFISSMYGGKGAYLWGTATPLIDSEGNIVGAIESIRDITERKRAEEALRIAKEEYHDLYEKAPLGYHTVDSQGRITDMNKTELNWLGYTREEIIGKKTIFDIQTPESANRGRKALQRLVKKGGVADIELEFVRKDGSVMPVNLHVSVLHNSKGEFIRTRSIVIDLTERKRAEEKLAKIVDSVNISAFAINSEHKITHWNTAVESLTGLKREAAVGSDKQWIAFYAQKRPVMADLIVDGAPERKFKDWYGDKYKKSSLIEGAYEASDFFPTLGEEGKWLLFTAAPLRDSEGTVIGAIETLQDITERKQVEDALRKSETTWRSLVERANDGITIIQDNIIRYANPRLAEMSGYIVEEITGTSFTDHISPEELPKVVDRYKRRMKGWAVTPIYKTVLRRKDGGKIYAELNAGIITFQGKPADLVFIRDITERKRAEEELRESEEKYRSLVESTEDSVYLVDRDCSYLFVNEKHLSRIGLSIDKIIGRTYGELHSEDETKEFAEIVEEVFETGKSVQHEHRSHRDNRYILRTLSPVRDSEGRVTAVTVVSKDITERKKAEERQSELLKELETVNNDLKDFAYIVSHDLKAPLRAITALAEWLSTDYKDKLDETGREQLDLLMNRVKRMHNLIDGILQYSRVGRLKEEKEVVDLNILVSEVITMIEPPENIDIGVVNELPTIVCKKTRMEQVFQNLLSNAVKYMEKPKGKIRIGCTDEEEYWKFSVADNGPGIEEKFFAKIFQIFQTMKPRDEVESTGIGLTIVKKIVETQGGKIWVESKVGEGSTFFFTIPKKERKSKNGGVFHSALCIFQLQGGGIL
jgi:PAS domain S-box-containing protein